MVQSTYPDVRRRRLGRRADDAIPRRSISLHTDGRPQIEREFATDPFQHPFVLGTDRSIESDDLLGRYVVSSHTPP